MYLIRTPTDIFFRVYGNTCKGSMGVVTVEEDLHIHTQEYEVSLPTAPFSKNLC